MLLPPVEPFSLRPTPRRCEALPSPARCACLGGTAPCDPVSLGACPTCREVWRQCRHAAILRLRGMERAIHPACWPRHLAHGTCPQCYAAGDACRCERNVVASYHSARDPVPLAWAVPSDAAEPLIGVEVEAMFLAAPDRETAGRALARELHAVDTAVLAIETDSSLGSLGLETQTIPLPLSLAREAIPGVIGAVVRAGGTCADSRCGGHIHVSATRRVVAGAEILAQSYRSPPQRAVWEAIAGRPCGPYCPVPETREGRATLDSGRSALHRAGSRTVEWRHPAGSDDPRIVLGRAELLLDAIDHAASQASGAPWGWGLYVRARPAPTPTTRYAWALLRSIGL